MVVVSAHVPVVCPGCGVTGWGLRVIRRVGVVVLSVAGCHGRGVGLVDGPIERLELVGSVNDRIGAGVAGLVRGRWVYDLDDLIGVTGGGVGGVVVVGLPRGVGSDGFVGRRAAVVGVGRGCVVRRQGPRGHVCGSRSRWHKRARDGLWCRE